MGKRVNHRRGIVNYGETYLRRYASRPFARGGGRCPNKASQSSILMPVVCAKAVATQHCNFHCNFPAVVFRTKSTSAQVNAPNQVRIPLANYTANHLYLSMLLSPHLSLHISPIFPCTFPCNLLPASIPAHFPATFPASLRGQGRRI